jgi:hypothetical protein
MAEAHARREAMIADKAAGARYRAGDATIVAEMRALNNFISEQKPEARLDAVMAGIHKSGLIESTSREHPHTSSELASAVDGLRRDGFQDETIKQIIEGAPVTAARHAEAEGLRDRLIKDREWVRRYRSGEVEFVQQMHRINAVLAAPIIETK